MRTKNEFAPLENDYDHNRLSLIKEIICQHVFDFVKTVLEIKGSEKTKNK